MQTESSFEPIQKEESPDVICPFKNPSQSKVSSSDKSEKGKTPEVIFTAGSKCSEMARSRDCINVKNIENEDDAWRWICKNVGIAVKITGYGNCGYCFLLVHVIMQEEHLMLI